jgi:hypothetical protein
MDVVATKGGGGGNSCLYRETNSGRRARIQFHSRLECPWLVARLCLISSRSGLDNRLGQISYILWTSHPHCKYRTHITLLFSASHSRVAPENVGLEKEQKCNTFAFIPVVKCGCVFWEFAKRKLATQKEKIR